MYGSRSLCLMKRHLSVIVCATLAPLCRGLRATASFLRPSTIPLVRRRYIPPPSHTPFLLSCSTRSFSPSTAPPHTNTPTHTTAMYEELTILGFVGLIFFSLQKADTFVDLSEHIFGEDAESKEVLPELAENVHMVLFAVMVVRLDQALGYSGSRRGGAGGRVCVCVRGEGVWGGVESPRPNLHCLRDRGARVG